ncbi:hypothetical protein K1W54_30150 [Micromonospora sp. CPCC 205371]|nr:hypothetical protein [Micromonospora sp. CPCC 205371]
MGSWAARRVPKRLQWVPAHWPVLVVFAAGVLLRLLTMVAYAPGLWFTGDSSVYLGVAHTLVPNAARPMGYSWFLWLLLPLHSVRLIVAVQHLFGLAVAALLYGFMVRRGVRRWIATAAVAVLLLDARTALLEQFLLAEALFTALLVGGMVALCWSRRPGVVVCGGAGLLFAAATTTRTVGLPLIGLAVLYLLVRRLGAVRVATFAMAAALPLAGYATLNQRHHGDFSLSSYSGRFLWARVSTFVDCDRLALTEAERPLCPPEPLGQRKAADLYLWSPGPNTQFLGRGNDARFESFARKAVRAQPVDYARTIAVETWRMVWPGGASDERYRCFDRLWRMPHTGDTHHCQALMAPADPQDRTSTMRSGRHEHPLMAPLHRYSRLATVPPTLVGVAVLFCAGAFVWQRRRRGQTGVVSGTLVVNARLRDLVPRPTGPQSRRRHDRRRIIDSAMWTIMGFVMLPIAVATSVMEPRYAVPALPLALVGMALATARRDQHGPVPRRAVVGAEPLALVADRGDAAVGG